jgi:ABC-type transport system, involved in lipoprotein release, permease component
MLKNYVLIAFRSMLKNKLFIVINIVGMSIAIACCIVAYFVYEYDATFDKTHLNGEAIYRISSNREFNNSVEKFGFVPLPLSGVINQNVKDVGRSTRYFNSWSNFKIEDDLFPSSLAYVDPHFFEMFSYEFIAGSPSAISDKSSVFISEKMASRLFKSPRDAYGKTITHVYGTQLKEIKVAGIFRNQPQNSSFYSREAFMNFDNVRDEFSDVLDEDWTKAVTLFVEILNPDRVASVTRQLSPYVENNNKVREDFIITSFVLDHFPSMARSDRDAQVNTWTWDAPPNSAIIGSGVMGILILLIACFNLTNTAIAISSRRLKEIGIRKVMGGMRKQLVIQFIGETMLICLISLLLGTVIAGFLADGWNVMWEYMRITPHYIDNPGFVLFLVGLLVVAGLIAGSYPAFYISSFEPISILKGKTRFGGTGVLSKVLLGGQFAISLMAIVSSVAFWQNAKYQEAYDLGFNVKGAVISWLNNGDEVLAYKNALSENPKVVSIAGAASGIFSNRVHRPIKHETAQVEVDIIEVGDHYLNTMNLSLIDGRDFIKDSETDKNESVIVSEKLARTFKWENPIGKEITYQDSIKLYVVGVVKDVYTMGLWGELEPLMIRYIGPEKYSQIVVSTAAGDASEINRFMEAKWKELFPYRLYNGSMLAVEAKEWDDVNKNILTMFAFLGAVAMLLSATGLFSLVSLNIIRRMKEIGVRKVLGASVANITRIVNAGFFIILVIASVVGSLIGYFAVDLLMGSIWHYYQPSNGLTFVFAIAVMFMISLGAVGYKIFTAASMNPVDTLRDE